MGEVSQGFQRYTFYSGSKYDQPDHVIEESKVIPHLLTRDLMTELARVFGQHIIASR